MTAGRLGLPVDREIVGLQVRYRRRTALALVWNYAIHGTMLGRRQPALLRRRDGRGFPGSRARPAACPCSSSTAPWATSVPAGAGRRRWWRSGHELAASVRAGWGQSDRRPDHRPDDPRCAFLLPAPVLSLRNCLGRWLPPSLTLPLGWAMPERDAELTAVSLGDVVWVVVPGELQSALGEAIKAEARRSFGRGFVAGVSNDYLGYFVTADAYRGPSYVACSTLYGPAAGDLLTRSASDPDRRTGGGAECGEALASPTRGGRARTSCGPPCCGG